MREYRTYSIFFSVTQSGTLEKMLRPYRLLQVNFLRFKDLCVLIFLHTTGYREKKYQF